MSAGRGFGKEAASPPLTFTEAAAPGPRGHARIRARPLSLTDPAAHPKMTQQITGRAGTVVIFNSHLWHGGTQNLSDRPRRALHSYFTRRGNQQQLDQKKYIRPQTLTRLSPAALFILDV